MALSRTSLLPMYPLSMAELPDRAWDMTTFRAGVANPPKLHRCASPQHWTRVPVDGVDARSAAIVKADPR
jgi:hypothetical protein